MIDNDLAMTVVANTSARWRWRLTSILALVAMVPMSLLPSGCAATDDSMNARAPQQPVVQTLGPALEEDLKTCVKTGVVPLGRHTYNLSFEVEATREGEMGEVKSTGDKLDDAAMEACIVKVLEQLPARDMIQIDEAFPRTSQSVVPSPASRSLVGNTMVLPNVIRLAPLIISAPGGVTIVVAVSIVVVAAVAIGSMSKKCKKQWKEAREYCEELLASPNPSRHQTGGYTNVEDCARGHVDEPCGGNRVDWGKQGRPGTRY